MRRNWITKTLLGLAALLLLGSAASGQSAPGARAHAQTVGAEKDQVLAVVWRYHRDGPPLKAAVAEIIAAEKALGHTITDELWTADRSPTTERGSNGQARGKWYVVQSYSKDGVSQVAQWIVDPPSGDGITELSAYALQIQNSPDAGAVERAAMPIAEHGSGWLAKSVEASPSELRDLRNAASARAQAIDAVLMEAAMNQVMQRWGVKRYFDVTLPANLLAKSPRRSSSSRLVEVAYRVPNRYSPPSGASFMAPATRVDGKPGYWLVTASWTVDGRRSEAAWISNPENGIVDPINAEAKQIDAALRAESSK